MATDYSANPTNVKNFTQSSEVNLSQSIKDYAEFLPAVNRSESLNRFFGSTVNQLLSSGSTQSIDAYWGRLAGRNYNPNNEQFNPETDATRLNYQFQPGTVSRLSGDVQQTVTYVNWIKRLESLGADIDNHDRLFSEQGYTLDIPVNTDMYINYANYYWLEGNIPLVIIKATVTDPIDIDDIVKLSQYTTPTLNNYATVEFLTGLRVQFTGVYITSTSGDFFADSIYYVENVGGAGCIKLVEIVDPAGADLFPAITPYLIEPREGWDTVDFDITSWDGTAAFEEYNVATTAERQDLILNKSYIVMERWASDKNPWARTNKWFSIHALQVATDYNGLELEAYLNTRTRANRPILEFKANMELFNTCKTFVETVDYAISLEQVTEMLSGVSNFFVDSENAIQNGDIVFVAKEVVGGVFFAYNRDFGDDFDSYDTDSGPFGTSYSSAFNTGIRSTFYDDAFTVSGVGTTITLTPFNTYVNNEYIIVSKGIEKGKIYCLKDDVWSISQNKNSRGDHPLFNLYDRFKVALKDFDNNDFFGDKIFSYKKNTTGIFDRELGFALSFTDQGTFSNYEFEWSLANARYNQDITVNTSKEITGYYFWRDCVEDTYYNGWSNIRGGQRVPIIQTIIADGTNDPMFELGTALVGTPTEFTVALEQGVYRWYEHSYIDRISIGYPNPEFIWKYDTEYTINDLISVDAEKLDFTDPFGASDAEIVVTSVSDVLKTLTINSAYAYDKILYRSLADSTVGGEIYLSDDNQNRFSVVKNGQLLDPNTDFTFIGTEITVITDTELDDVIELNYIADADIADVVYDVAPIHYFNSDNKPFLGAGYDDLINHMSHQLSALPGFTGAITGLNNYHKILRQNTYGGLIRQQIFRTKHIQYLLDQEDINPVRAIKNFSKDYANFKRFFQNKIKQLWTTESWNTVRELVDRALGDINIGKSESFKYVHSDMAYFKQSKNTTYSITNTTTTFALPELLNRYGDTQNHIQVFLNEYNGAGAYFERPMVNGIDYNIVGPDVELTTAVILNGTPDPATLTIRWYDHKQLSGIPFSAVKLGFFKPTQVEVVGTNLIGHDGSYYALTGTELTDMTVSSFDVVGAALWDFELRVFNNLVPAHFVSVDELGQDMMDFYPNSVSEYSYTVADLNTRLDDWYNRYAIRNNITEIDDVTYDGGNEFTWNYLTVGPGLGSWRSLYVYTFGTDRPHTHPWEMLGHKVKPTWWDATYSWTAGTLRDSLQIALIYGITGNSITPHFVDIRYARSSYDWINDTLVSSDGLATLIAPVTAVVIAAPTAINAAKDFVFGDWSEIENIWRKSSEYLFALSEVYIQLKPYRIHETFWSLNRWDINRGVTQEQWIDSDTCQRAHVDELHNQQITDGIISKITVVSGGSGYAFLNLNFKQDNTCYRNPFAEAYTSGGVVVGVAVLDPGRGFDNAPEVDLAASIAAAGVELEYVIDFDFTVTHLGFNTLASEEYRANVDSTNDLTKLLENLEINYMLHVGGFTDKRILAIEVDGNFESGTIRIPDSSYDILIDRNAPIKTVFYSGVKIEKVEGLGYRVDGYDLDSKFFNFLRPSTAGAAVTVNIGTSQVTKYTNWRNEVTRIPYRSLFVKRQELYQFLLGLGKYYETVNFDAFTQWEVEAKAAIEWALDSIQVDPFYVNGVDVTLSYQQGTHGVVQTVDINYDGVFNVLDNSFKNIRRNELFVLRDNDKTEFSLKDEQDRLFGLGVQVIEFEHIIVLDNVTTFSDPIYQPEIGIGQNRVRLVGERTRNWNGRVEAPGYIIQDRGIILNIESSVRELEQDWVTSESKALERLTRQTIGYNVGYSKPTYMTNTFIGDKAAYQFEKGARKYKGTAEAIAAMTRNKNIFGTGFDHELYEEWMVRLGDYGDVSERNPLQFVVNVNKIKSDPQHFRFNANFVSDKSDDLIIDLHKGSPDSISGNYSTPFSIYSPLRLDNTSIATLEQYQNFTRDAGLPLVSEIDYFLGSIDNIGDIYDPTQDYALIPNWTEIAAYVKGELVRLNGFVYRLTTASTGLTNINQNIIIRGTQVFPQVVNGLTLIINGITTTFVKINTSINYDDVVIDGSVNTPTVPSGDTLVIDGININFIKTETNTTYSDIILDGNVTNPTIVNSATKTLVIGYANSVLPTSLTNVTVDFDELSPTLTMQQIWVNSLNDAGDADPLSEANTRISQLEILRGLYITANSVSAWETFVDNYYDAAPSPDRYVNPEYLGTQVAANIGAIWETAARNLIQTDLDLVAEIGATHTETITTMVVGPLNDGPTWIASRDLANDKLDFVITVTDNNENLQSFRAFVENNGGITIAQGTEVTVAQPIEYVTNVLAEIETKITAALLAATAPTEITASTTGNILTLTRVSNSIGYRLGVTTDVDLGFVADDNDVETSVTTITSPVDLTLSEAVQVVNNASVTGVSAAISSNVMRLTSSNQTLVISSGTANNDLGFNVGTFSANATTVSVPVDLAIGDVVTQVNNKNITDLVASQIEGRLLLTYSSDTLIIGDGTANEEIGITADTYTSRVDDIQNTFNTNDWEVIQDPAHFNIWAIDNIGSNVLSAPTPTNRFVVYQTLDFQLGVNEICAGAESGDDALVNINTEHSLSVNEYVLIINSTCVPSVDGIHQVTSLLNDFGFYIDRYIEKPGFTGKIFPLRSVRFPNTTEANNAMTDTDYVQGTLGLRTNDYVYVDEVLDGNLVSLGYGAVYRVERTTDGAGLFLVRNETGKTDNTKIKNGVLYSNTTGKTVIEFEVFDPLKGIIPGIAEREIDFRSDVDFAYYNNTTDANTEIRAENSWGDKQIGTVWWDLSNAIYLNYDQSDPEYRQEHWGELFPTATIDIYEWTKSPVTPDEYTNAVQAKNIIDGIELTGNPYAITNQFGEEQFNWCEKIEINASTNQLETFFYFWVKNKTTTPTLEREYSVLQLADVIFNPTTQQVDWLAASGLNTLLVSSLTKATGFDDLVMQVNFDSNASDYHQEFALLAENDPTTIIPEWLHISLRDSLAGFTQYKRVYEYVDWSASTTYLPSDVIFSATSKYYRCHTTSLNNNPDSDTNNDFWTLLEAFANNADGIYTGIDLVTVNEPQSIPDLTLHPSVRYGIETRLHQTWFISLSDARKVVVDKLNAQLKLINLVDSDIPWREEFERSFFVGDLEYDITEYWNFVSWSHPNFDFDQGTGDYFIQAVSDLTALAPNKGEIARVETSADSDGRSRRSVHIYDGDVWVLIYKEKATIKFNTCLWENFAAVTGWDIVGWDTNGWDKSSSAVMVEIFDSFYNRIWIEEHNALYGDIWFHMAKHVLQEQPEVDWIFKTSYFKIIAEDELEKQYNKYFTENADEFFDFVNTIKPFRSKLREGIVRKVADDELDLTTLDALELRVQTNPVDDTIDEADTRSFRLTVGSDGLNYSSQIVDANKVLLGLDIGPDNVIIPYLNTGSGTLPGSPGIIWIDGERITYTAQTNVASAGIGSGFTSGFSTGFGGVVLLTGVVRGTQGTFARKHSFATVIEDSTNYELTEFTTLSDWATTITPAWNDLGAGLLEAGNTDLNGVTINADGFGTIDLYGNIYWAHWLALQEPTEVIQNFQRELKELIDVFWAQNY